METDAICQWRHAHDFCGEFAPAEKRTRRVLVLNTVMMIVEIIGGLKLRSMALYADGWHMATHVSAFVIAAGAYALARRHARHASYSFGTGKIAVLGAYTSAIILGAIAVFMAGQSILRLFHPVRIEFNEAIAVAALGLVVNLTSAILLKDRHHHGLADHHHDHNHNHNHGHSHRPPEDLNLRAAYVHVLADAVTSLLAILALTGGKFCHYYWLDAVMGLVGAAIITQWAWRLVRDTYVILLDRQPDSTDLELEIRRTFASEPDTAIADLHIWQLAVNKFAAIISIVAREPKSPSVYKDLLREHSELVHVTVEVNQAS